MTPAGDCRMTPEQIRALKPGPVLDELAGRAAGLEPRYGVAGDTFTERWTSVSEVDAEDMAAAWREMHDSAHVVEVWRPYSTDPTASDELALAALKAGLGWPFILFKDKAFGAYLQIPEEEIIFNGVTRSLEVHFTRRAWGTIPTHARALAVALGAKR